MQRVLVVSSDRPLLAGINDLLKVEEDFILMSTSANEISGIIQEAKDAQSSVVIMDDSQLSTDQTHIQELLLAFSELRVVVISSSGNTLQIFDKKATEVYGFQGLVSIIRGSK